MKRIILIPIRLLLGLPPIYGLTIKSRVLMLLRKTRLYHGRIDFVCRVKTVHISETVQPSRGA